jgi:transcriptional regulator of NAD metabolism
MSALLSKAHMAQRYRDVYRVAKADIAAIRSIRTDIPGRNAWVLRNCLTRSAEEMRLFA